MGKTLILDDADSGHPTVMAILQHAGLKVRRLKNGTVGTPANDEMRAGAGAPRTLPGQRREDTRHFREPLAPAADADPCDCQCAGPVLAVSTCDQADSKWLHTQRILTLGNISSRVAHDLNNLLSVILGLSDLLRDHVQPGSEPDEVANRIIAAGKRGRTLTKQILEFSRAEPGARAPVSLGQVACEALDLVRVVLRPSTDLSVDLRAPNATIVADKGQIAQVITNLTINASDSLPNGVGRVGLTVDVTDELRPEIAAARAMGQPSEGTRQASPRSWSSAGITWTLIGAVPEGPSLSATIHDTGAGISDAQLQQIFEPYYTTKPQGSGTGLGLAIARRIVLDHGGALLVRSRAGLGSTFEVILPAAG